MSNRILSLGWITNAVYVVSIYFFSGSLQFFFSPNTYGSAFSYRYRHTAPYSKFYFLLILLVLLFIILAITFFCKRSLSYPSSCWGFAFVTLGNLQFGFIYLLTTLMLIKNSNWTYDRMLAEFIRAEGALYYIYNWTMISFFAIGLLFLFWHRIRLFKKFIPKNKSC